MHRPERRTDVCATCHAALAASSSSTLGPPNLIAAPPTDSERALLTNSGPHAHTLRLAIAECFYSPSFSSTSTSSQRSGSFALLLLPLCCCCCCIDVTLPPMAASPFLSTAGHASPAHRTRPPLPHTTSRSERSVFITFDTL